MSLLEVFLFAIGVSLDSLVVAMCKGAEGGSSAGVAAKCGICFSVFQLIMPCLGFFLGRAFHTFIDSFDHFVVFGVLLVVGLNMFKEAFCENDKPKTSGFFSIFLIAFFSSFDSLSVGLTLSIYNYNIFVASAIIAAMTFAFSVVGALVGKFFKKRHKRLACIAAGVILIALGTKVLISHLI